jgi:hypothetical protein
LERRLLYDELPTNEGALFTLFGAQACRIKTAGVLGKKGKRKIEKGRLVYSFTEQLKLELDGSYCWAVVAPSPLWRETTTG